LFGKKERRGDKRNPEGPCRKNLLLEAGLCQRAGGKCPRKPGGRGEEKARDEKNGTFGSTNAGTCRRPRYPIQEKRGVAGSKLNFKRGTLQLKRKSSLGGNTSFTRPEIEEIGGKRRGIGE